MTTVITDHTDLRIALEGKMIDRIETTSYDQPGFASLKLIMGDGAEVYLTTVTRNGGSFITVDAS